MIGPLLFLIYINDIHHYVTSDIHLFADDCLIQRPICNEERDTALLQADLHKLSEWSRKWLLKFNVGKCHHLRVTTTRRLCRRQYTLDGQVIQKTNSANYLGITLSSNFKWDSQIDNVSKKSTRLIGLLRRNFKKAPHRKPN